MKLAVHAAHTAGRYWTEVSVDSLFVFYSHGCRIAPG